MNRLGLPLPSAVAALALGCLCSASAQETLIPAGSTWKFSDSGPLDGAAWRNPDFDDSSWPSGPAQLGYGDGDETTTVSFGPNSSSRYITTYFRKSFTLTNPDIFPELLVEVLRDDGAVVWLNGTEVFRSNLPAGPVLPGTHASATATSAEAASAFVSTLINPALLSAGENTLAVEVHQDSHSSSDLSFDLRLAALSPAITRGPYLNRTSPTETTVRWGTDENALNHSISLPDLTTEHIVRITGLTPETRYFYSIGSSTLTLSSGPYYNNFSMPADGECGGVPSGTRAYYSFNYANTHFICLDSEDSPRAAGGAMAQWLAADLDATSAEWIIAFWHHPPYTKGTHNSDSLSDSSGRMTHMLEIILPITAFGFSIYIPFV